MVATADPHSNPEVEMWADVQNELTEILSSRLFRSFATVGILAISFGLAGCSGGYSQPPPPPPPGCGNSCSPSPEFLYAMGPGHILAFTIDQTTGALGAASAIAGPNQSTGMVSTITLGHLYVSDFLNDTVEGFTANATTGALSAIAGSPFSLGGTPPGAGGLSPIVPAGTYLYATDLNAGKVAGFAFDSASGKLTPVPGSPFPAGNTPVQAAQAGFQGKFLYVSDLNDSAGGISAFTIDFNTGALSPIPGSPFPTGPAGSFPGPSALVVNGNFLYVALAGTVNANNKIVAFAIDPNTGVLSSVAGSPFLTGADPLYMALVPVTLVGFQSFLYTANIQDNTISAFTVNDNTGVLTPVNGSPYSGASTLAGLAVTSTHTSAGNFFLYAADQAGNVRGYTVDGGSGALTPIPGSPFTAANSPVLLCCVLEHMVEGAYHRMRPSSRRRGRHRTCRAWSNRLAGSMGTPRSRLSRDVGAVTQTTK
jgi:6-phosphogluconolactonase (cycloisomerase 2 family)